MLHREWGRRRRRAMWGLVAACTAFALVAVTWVVAVRFQSPAQREAAAQPPSAQPIVVEVVRDELAERTTVMATARAGDSRNLTIPRADGTAVVTRAGVSAGSTLGSGQVVTWINDRPVIAIRGSFPLYRDLGIGDTGADVRMVQEALADLGYAITPDGTFGSYTADCIGRLYSALGAAPATRTVSARTQTASGEQAETATQQTVQTYAPANEFMVVADLPARVAAAPAEGLVLSEQNAVLTLTNDSLTLSAQVPGSVAVRLTQGTTGTAQLGSDTVAIRVSSVTQNQEEASAQQDAPDSSQRASVPMDSEVAFVATEGSFPEAWAGRDDVLVTLDLTPPLSDVITVPERAIATDSAGTSSVLLAADDGTFIQTPVEVISCVLGTCALADSRDGVGIAEGDQVRVDR